MLRVPTPLTLDEEEVVHRVIGCCITVHRGLGPGLLEGIYRRALSLELGAAGLTFEVERRVPVLYKGRVLCEQRLDLVVGEVLLVELKALDRLAPIHRAQVISYLRVSNLRIGLLVNFNAVTIPDGLQRIVVLNDYEA
jgi:GxxExxY protein